MKTTFDTNFVVMPIDCNYMKGSDGRQMIHGGSFFSKLDLAAAGAVDAALAESECKSAVTYKVLDLTFHAACFEGDIVFLHAEITEVRRKAITIKVVAHRKQRGYEQQDLVADAVFVFVTKKNGEFHDHGLTLEK